MDKETFRPFRKAPEAPPAPPAPVEINPLDVQSSNPIIAKALAKNKERLAQQANENMNDFYEEPPRSVPVEGTPQTGPYYPSGPARQNTEQPMPREIQPIPNRQGPRVAAPMDDKLATLLAKAERKTNLYSQVQLPSLGKFYDGIVAPTDGIVHVRKMSGHEEEVVCTPQMFKGGVAINTIFKACVQEPIKPELMLTADRTALLIYIRGITLGKDYEVEVRCPSCQMRFQEVIDLNRDLTACPDDFGPHSLVDTLPETGFRFRYRLATGSDDIAVNEYQERRSKKKNPGPDDTFHYKASLLLISIEDQESGVIIDDRNSIRTLIHGLPMNDLALLRNVLSDQPFGMDTNCPIDCPSCGEHFEVELPLELSFFFPNLKKARR